MKGIRHDWRNLKAHALWQFVFTTADRDAAAVVGTRFENIMEMYLCRRCFISVWALWKIKISLCLWEESGWRGEGPAVCAGVCVQRNEDGFSCAVNVCVCVCAHCNSVLSETSRRKKEMWQKVQITSWRQPLQTSCCEVKNISAPHLRRLHSEALPHVFPSSKITPQNVCSGAWKRELVTVRLKKTKEIKQFAAKNMYI